jgi:hypothetical protein
MRKASELLKSAMGSTIGAAECERRATFKEPFSNHQQLMAQQTGYQYKPATVSSIPGACRCISHCMMCAYTRINIVLIDSCTEEWFATRSDFPDLLYFSSSSWVLRLQQEDGGEHYIRLKVECSQVCLIQVH